MFFSIQPVSLRYIIYGIYKSTLWYRELTKDFAFRYESAHYHSAHENWSKVLKNNYGILAIRIWTHIGKTTAFIYENGMYQISLLKHVKNVIEERYIFF